MSFQSGAPDDPTKPDKITFATDWLAQAEHGGFYQAVAEGTYKKHGLDVTIRMGGPQVNGLQLIAVRQLAMIEPQSLDSGLSWYAGRSGRANSNLVLS